MAKNKQWQPLKRGMRHGILTEMTHDGKQVMDLQSTTVWLPDGIALCELVEVPDCDLCGDTGQVVASTIESPDGLTACPQCQMLGGGQ